MKFKIILFSYLSIFSVQVYAAIESPQIQEVIRLPVENAKILIKGKSDYYLSLRQVAFDKNQKMNIRWKAIQLLPVVKKDTALQDLLKLIEQKEWFVKSAALNALNSISPNEAKPRAVKLLQNKALVVRSAALEILVQKPDELDRDLLWEELDANYNFKNGHSLWIRGQIVEALAKYPLEREKIKFQNLTKDKDGEVQKYSKMALQNITNMYQLN